MSKEVFVTYSWDNREHQEKVISFCNYLRENGFNAEMDRSLSQKETAIDFTKMMYQGMLDYKKVVIVLSTGYKEKADKFTGGVGKEYELMIKDIDDNPQKYILVTFEGRHNGIYPLGFKSRDTIDLTKKEEQQNLFSKLKDEQIYQFSKIADSKPDIIKVDIPSSIFRNEKNAIEITGITCKIENSNQYALLYKNIRLEGLVGIRNFGNSVLNDYSIEVNLPLDFAEFPYEGRIDSENICYTFNSSQKIFPTQTIETARFRFLINYLKAEKAFNSEIKIKVFSESGLVEQSYKMMDLVKENSYQGIRPITIDKFYRD